VNKLWGKYPEALPSYPIVVLAIKGKENELRQSYLIKLYFQSGNGHNIVKPLAYRQPLIGAKIELFCTIKLKFFS
jgi:hypothetical protein